MPVTFEEIDSSDEDSEVQDEADEDSNGLNKYHLANIELVRLLLFIIAEDWYTNDYPDEGESEDSNNSGGTLAFQNSLPF